ncbi:GPP34 family phosphoprotein [Frankia sp. CNm7]|uniref:GPP34 family phosphoprotein n=1 Tax=Frankia nepalensis TaxID=1836974 RepID=A0A937RLA4_9ACTN|nr:GPP34 family phosphoprotein [Frankia nepalensis]MBL7497526.1 GPP34 family phosphoprotein [Frankia nepalensis]MBL7510208.1 GPP34 family phosphoprotein [Frankia nepalensis]MBL7524437.1 GPP34 family phosphoprotein [Frankia nepalensis]MBL7630919.1 GPP34 family phosphoprotein [Frankia nepalensis]
MDLPESLPAQLYLLTYNPDKGRMDGAARSGHLGPALRAAALLELRRRGRIGDDGGKVVVTGRASRPGGGAFDDPILARVLGQIEESARQRSWSHWIGQDNRRTTRCARDYLEAGRWLRVERDRVLGVFPRTTVTVRDRRVVRALINDVRRALRGPTPTDRLDVRARELAALGALAQIRVLASGRELREHKGRVESLMESIAPAGPALRKVVREQQAQAAAAGG